MTSSDPLHDLQISARRYANCVVPGSIVRRVVILDDHREKIAEIRVPPCGIAPDDPPASPPGHRPGWDFSAGVPQYDGATVPIAGRPLDVLRALAESEKPLKIEELRKIWGGYDVGESTIRFAIKELRKRLGELFPSWEEGDAVPAGPHGYSLLIR
jgi:hypothetical protein